MNPPDPALLVAVLRDPDADLPRLALADDLDDRGEAAWAEVIRVQCRLAELTVGGCCEPTGDTRDEVDRKWDDLDRERHRLVSRQYGLLKWFCQEDMAAAFGLPNHETILPIDGGLTAPGLGVDLLFRRGFPDEVRCTLEQFAGGPCGRCEGSGRVWRNHPGGRGQVECPDCSGAGRTAGLAPALFASQPVRLIRWSDVRVRAEIDPPGKDYGWQVNLFRDGEADYYDMNGWEERDEMVQGLVKMATDLSLTDFPG